MTAELFTGGDPSKLSVAGYTKGDLVASNAAGTLTAVPVGTGGFVLTADAVALEGVDWQAGGGGGGGVNSVFARVGNVVAQSGDYTKAQVGLGNVDNTSDANKPVSTAQAAADALRLLASSNLSDLTNVPTARTNLGLGTAATQPSSAFDAAGAAAAAQAASQPLDSDLTTIAGLTATTDNFLQSKASAWASRTPAQVATDLQTAGLAPAASPTLTGTVTISGREVVPSDALTDASTIATDAALGNYFRVTLNVAGATRTLGNPTNPTDGQKIMWELIQDGSGNRALTLDTKFVLGTDITAVTLSTAINKRDFLGAVYNSTADRWYVIAFVKGY